ncbi:hypothetical protein [Alishewanella sp. SMS8]|uniref:hypothetical protein n=1 Tax=Alishewanella sp. SMS8 TaxID=2994676 RepID=UPI0027422395|nr:hypothetical protein [Alishewanella sp. SMS8]MDP4945643.1 hypothetical protein [Alishewanella sp.]MDP5207620.1 hypothetical protein [Alishewanella sp. SMS9]MDP5035002.1 hypothetical protein [Alishewanella sp.]MDP5186894.1 hypothetical protein [Alishewanella sp.]MDP5460576.1 hypothetical protein [Alishewanella sp. SMS8]
MIKRLLTTSSLLLCFSPFSMAQSPLANALEQCRTLTQTAQRLACYDAINTSTNTLSTSAPTLAPAEVVQTKPEVAAEVDLKTIESQFGHERKQAVDNIEQITSIVRKVSYSLRKEVIVEFENDQVWRQTHSAFYPISVGEAHHIKRGAVGSFYLANDKNNRTLKVRRID